MDIDTMPAGREMDRLVAEKVMGWKQSEYNALSYEVIHKAKPVAWFAPGSQMPKELPRYSTDIAAAWEVLQKACKISGRPLCIQGQPSLSCHKDYPDNNCQTCIWTDDETPLWSVVELEYHDFQRYAFGDTPELAICRAALKAFNEQEEEKKKA